METVVSILLIVLIVVAMVAIFLTLRKEGFSAEGWARVRNIVYEGIEDGLKIYQGKEMSMEELEEIVAHIVYRRVQVSEISQEDKNFWTVSRIKAIIRSVLEKLVKQAEKKNRP